MSIVAVMEPNRAVIWPGWWRTTVIALSTLALCSCRAAPHVDMPDKEPPPLVAVPHVQALATITPHIPRAPDCEIAAAGCAAGCGCSVCGGCTQCRITPNDELICDGGDIPPGVLVSPEWRVYGLDETDAVAHFDSVTGKTCVQPSNRVCIYAPRFGAVRVVTRVAASEQVQVIEGAVQPVRAERNDDILVPNMDTQNLQPIGGLANRLPESFEARQREGLTSTVVVPRGVQDALLPYENLSIIRLGILENSDKARLAQVTAAALIWSNVQSPQIQLEHQAAQVAQNAENAQLTYTVDLPQCPKLRLVKVASTLMASPGEFVDFTLRFDNVGDQAIGNVVILDDLSARLEYVEGSEQSSVEATFSTSANVQGSLVVRWEIRDALLPGQGGIVKFRTRVR